MAVVFWLTARAENRIREVEAVGESSGGTCMAQLYRHGFTDKPTPLFECETSGPDGDTLEYHAGIQIGCNWEARGHAAAHARSPRTGGAAAVLHRGLVGRSELCRHEHNHAQAPRSRLRWTGYGWQGTGREELIIRLMLHALEEKPVEYTIDRTATRRWGFGKSERKVVRDFERMCTETKARFRNVKPQPQRLL